MRTQQDTREPRPPVVPEPIAVIGAGCRLPGGAESPEEYWDLLLSGRDGIRQVPDDRWQAYREHGPGFRAAVRRATVPGAFLSDIAGFDAEFFGLTPREAELMDPQQRILLEVVWEALEHAGIAPRRLAGGDTGVFVGIGSDDYGRRLLEDLPSIEAWTGIGGAMCAAANRISHALDLRGPSLAVDTACSASLVATHLACQSLRARESGLALVGGINLIISPGLTLTLESAGATAQDGRCKPFDATADGYGRGEGGAVLVLKRLDDAQRDGDRVLAVIRGSHVSQDGRTNGIMAPNGAAQRALLEDTCRRARIAPESVGYVETHGTGTRLGDPLEADALSAVYGRGREAGDPCLIGSVKPNIGHLEAGAGIASLLKVTLALVHEQIPPSLNFTEGNPSIDWAGSGLRVVTGRTPWPRGDRPRRAGVSGFGYGGTIGHILLEEAPEQAPEPDEPVIGSTAEPAESGPWLFPLSAGSESALREYASRLIDRLSGDDPLTDVGHTLALRRSHLDRRAAIVAADAKDLQAKLRLLVDGERTREVVSGGVPADPGSGLVWVFSGHGSQWAGMGRELLESEPAFAAVIDELEPVFLDEMGVSPQDALLDTDGVDRVQTMIFTVQLGLAAVWRSYGVTPDAVIGHSVGEIAAAVTCGALSLQDGAKLICRRSRLLRRVAGRGAMAMASLSFEEARRRLAGRVDAVPGISASPSSTVISGDIAAIEALVEEWRAEGVQMHRVASDVAFHSPQMEPLLAELSAAAADLAPREPEIPMYTSALPDLHFAPLVDGDYWAANLRNPVRLTAAVEAAAGDGYRAFIEISAHPVVTHSVNETLSDLGLDDAFVGCSLRRKHPERASLLAAIGAAHCEGVAVNWTRLQPTGDLVDLPSVAWQRRRHWRDSELPGAGQAFQHDVDSHSLLGPRVSTADRPLWLWHTVLDDSCRPYPGSHTINGTEIVPAAVLINTFLSAAEDATGRRPALSDLTLRVPLTVAERREIQVVHDENGLRLASRPTDGDGSWLTHTTATAVPPEATARPSGPVESLDPADPDDVRRHLASVGVPTMGFDWTIEQLTRGHGVIRARVRVAQPAHAPATWAPGLDAALSIAPAAYPGQATLRMVAHLGRVEVMSPPLEVIDVHVAHSPDDGTVGIVVRDADGRPVATLERVRYEGLEQDEGNAPARPQDLVHEMVWRPFDLSSQEREDRAAPGNVVLVGGHPDLVAALRTRLASTGAKCRVLDGPEGLSMDDGLDGSVDVLVLPDPGSVDASVPEASAAGVRRLLDATRRLATPATVHSPRLWCVTVGARESLGADQLAQAPLWGLGRVIAGEHDQLWGGVVDLPADDPAGAVGELLDVLRAAPGEDVIAVRGGRAEVARLARTERPPTRGPVACRADGTYLITGGLGVLGVEVARWLAERGARRLVLLGRRELPARSSWHDRSIEADAQRRIAGVEALEAMGVTVRVVSVDIADAAATARALAPDALGMPAIRGVVHAAGVLDNRMVTDTGEESLRRVMRPKVDGAWTLHTLFPTGSLDFFVLFSSCGQLLGLPGQAAYGPANAFLDALASHRNGAAPGSGDTTSFAWTSWRGQGMAVNDVVDRELRRRGITDISVPEAFGAWEFTARRGAGCFPVLGVRALDDPTERPPLLRELSAVNASPAAETADGERESLAAMPAEELREHLIAQVAVQIAGEMRLPAAMLDVRRSLVEQGLDSVMTIVVRRRLEKTFGHKLPATLLWQQPNVTGIAEHLVELIACADAS